MRLELRIAKSLNITNVNWTHDGQEFYKANFNLNSGLREV